MNKIWTIMDILRWTESHFRGKGVGTPRLDAELLVAHAMGLRRIDLYMRAEQPLNGAERSKIKEFIKRRTDGEPVAYITGQKEFWAMPFNITRDVLIPRPETEELVEKAHVLFLERADEPLKFLELGAGSGCISAALAREFPKAMLIASDISEPALDVARKNMKSLGLSGRARLVLGDLYEPVGENEGPFSLIISNPPYIPSQYIEALPPEVKMEPLVAYDGGPDGLDYIKPIIEGAPERLKPGGHLLIEIHESHEKVVENLTPPGLFFESIGRDLARLPRYAWWRKPADY